ncbi:hypothetical protein [Psychroserpens sp. S379A]
MLDAEASITMFENMKNGVRVRVIQENNIYYNEMRALEFVSQQLKP